MNYFALSGLLNFIVSAGAGVFVLLKNPSRMINRNYFLLCLSIALWSFGYWQWQITKEKEMALFWTRFLTASSVFIPTFYFYFILSFLHLVKDKRQKMVLYAGYTLSFIFLAMSFTPLLVESVSSKMSFRFWPRPGMFYSVYLLHFFGFVIYTHILMFKKLNVSAGFKRNQLKYLFLGSIMGFGGGATNFPLWFDIYLYPYGNFAVLLFFVFYTYAVFRYRLMDINIIFKRSMAYSLAVGLLTGLFVALVLTITNLISTFSYSGSLKISIFAAIIIAVLFNPLRNEIQSIIDRIFYKKSYDYYGTVRKVSSDLSSMFDPGAVYDFVGNIIYSTLGLRNIQLLAPDQTGGYRTVLHVSRKHKGRQKESRDENETAAVRLTGKSGIVKFYRKSQDILIKEEILSLSEELNSDFMESMKHDFDRFQGVVSVPVFADNKLVLLIILGEKVSGDMFTLEDMDLLRTISHQTAIALKNARFYQEKVNSEKLASIGMMSATFAHEIRNPLTSLKTFAQLMPEKYNDPEFRDTFSRIVVGEIEKIDGLIGDLLDFSSEKKSARFNDIDLTGLVDEVVDSVRDKLELERSGIVVEKRYNGDSVRMMGDAGKLKQAFSNIIINGCQAMHEQGTLRVDIRRSGKHVDVTVEDTGDGIHPEDMSRIFDPFVTTKEMGVGLGLAISKRIIEGHNGRINVKSQLSKGSVFTVSLPVQND